MSSRYVYVFPPSACICLSCSSDIALLPRYSVQPRLLYPCNTCGIFHHVCFPAKHISTIAFSDLFSSAAATLSLSLSCLLTIIITISLYLLPSHTILSYCSLSSHVPPLRFPPVSSIFVPYFSVFSPVCLVQSVLPFRSVVQLVRIVCIFCVVCD